MAPKAKHTNIYVVASSGGVDSVYSDVDAAHERVVKAKSEGQTSVRVEVHSLIGTTTVAPAGEDKKSVPAPSNLTAGAAATPAKPKSEGKAKESKPKEPKSESKPKEIKPKEPKSESKAKAKDDNKAKTETGSAATAATSAQASTTTAAATSSSAPAPTSSSTAPTSGSAATPAKSAATPAKTASKTVPADEQRAANAKKGSKAADGDLPANVQSLLNSTSSILKGLTIVVTGVPPTIGRKNAEKLVESHGGKLGKSITGKTSLVVLGNDAGPKKLESIKDHNIETIDEDGLIKRLEAGGPTTANNPNTTSAAPSSSSTAAAPSASPSKKRSADDTLVKKSAKKAKE